MDDKTHTRNGTPAKFTTPSTIRVLPRERLFASLDQALEGRVVWVSAPGGMGKTTLVAHYLQSRSIPALWYRVDQDDADPATFFAWMTEAAAHAAEQPAGRLAGIPPVYSAGLSTLARAFFRRFCLLVEPISTLVLDDYHELPDDAPLHTILRYGLEELPDNFRVIVVSRAVPPPELVRLRTQSSFTLLDGVALRLSEDESLGIGRLRQKSDVPFGESIVRAAHAHTQGWVAGLILLLEQAADNELPACSPSTRDFPLVFDYFAMETFACIEPAMRDLLMRIAQMPRVTAAEARALTGMVDTHRLLNDLVRRNFFTAKHKRNGEEVFEFHPLFREFLREQCERTLSIESLVALKREAVRLLEKTGDIDRAFTLLEEMGDTDAMGACVLAHAQEMLAQGRQVTLANWLSRLPRGQVDAVPHLQLLRGLCCMPTDPDTARESIVRAYEGFKAAHDNDGMYLAWSALADSFLLSYCDLTAADPWLAELEWLRTTFPAPAADDTASRLLVSSFALLLMRQPTNPEVDRLADELGMIIPLADAALTLHAATNLLMYHMWWQGDYASASRLIEKLAVFLTEHTPTPLIQLSWEVWRCNYGWLTGRFDITRESRERGLELARESGVHLMDFHLLIQGVWTAAEAGDFAGCRGVLDELEPHLDLANRLDGKFYHWLAFCAARAAGDQSALRLYARQLARQPGLGIACTEAYPAIAMAWAALSDGDAASALASMREARERALTAGARLVIWDVLFNEAELHFALGDTSGGEASLRAFFSMGARHGLLNAYSLVFSKQRAAELCAVALERGIEPQYVCQTISRRRLFPEAPPTHLDDWPWPIRIKAMGNFVVEVDERPLSFDRKQPSRPLQLLKALVALGPYNVPQERLCDALWPDAEGDAARQAFETNLHRLRKLLGNPEALLLREGTLSVNPRLCWIDTQSLEALFARLDPLPDNVAAHVLTERLLRLCSGPFLQGEDGPWALGARRALHQRLQDGLELLAAAYVARNDVRMADRCLAARRHMASRGYSSAFV